MKNKLYTVLLFALIILCLQNIACKKSCADEPIITEGTFGGSYIATFPQTGNEVLKFLRNGTDTIKFRGQGIQDYFNEVERAGGDCPIKYRLLSRKISYIDSSSLRSLNLLYYFNSETNAWQEYFEIHFSDFLNIGPYLGGSVGPNQSNSMNILGVTYPYVEPYKSNNNTDSLYATYSPLVTKLDNRIVRIKYQNDTYEILP